jgi:DNA helicase-2/ATP-dependent DNA helicase PcrA
MINAIREFDEEHPGATLDAFLQDISLLTDADKKVDDSKGHVTLMTIHMAKGLEFNTVHIAGCDDGIFPLIRESSMLSVKEANDQLEEERRLFYVGCTRAEKKLYLYHAERRFFQGTIRPFAPSRFLKELDPSVVEFTPCIDERPAFTDWTPDAPEKPRYNSAPSFVRNRSFGSGASSTGSSGFSGGSRFGGSRSSVPDSVRKNDRRIVYRNPIKVAPTSQSVDTSGPRIVYDEYSENPFHPGAKVRHIKYGVGTVTRCYGEGDNARVDVRFGDGNLRTIILKYAALQVVG